MRIRAKLLMVMAVLLLAGVGVWVVFGSDYAAATGGVGDRDTQQIEGAATSEGPSGIVDLGDWDDPRRTRELVGLRDARSKTYELATGQLEWVSTDEIIHYKDVSGAWQEIDNRIISEGKRAHGVAYAYRNAANSHVVRMAASAGGERMIQIERDGKSLAFGPAGADRSRSVKGAATTSKVLSDLAVAEHCVTYPDLYPGVDLVYESTSTGVREYLVLSGPSVGNRFTFDLSLDGVAAKESDGGVVFVDDSGATVFWLGAPLAVDETREVTGDVTYALSGEGEDRQLTVTVSREYLDDPARVFPVIVDPDLMVGGTATMDSFVNTTTPNTVHPYNDPYLRTGYYSGGSGWRRSLIRFNLSGVNIPASYVDYGYILIEQCYGANPKLKGFPCLSSWSSSSVTWNNQPYCSSTYSTSGSYWNGSGWWWRLWTTTPIKKWLSGEWTNYGFTIKDTREWTKYPESAAWFFSSDSASSHRPQLHIVYTQPPEPTTTTTLPPLPANTLVEYPAYTYTEESDSSQYLSDPLNLFFCDSATGGTWGSADGVRDQIVGYMDYLANVWGDNQYVLFEATYGAADWVRNDHQMGTVLTLLDRYHLRVFEDPYVSLSGYAAGQNCVGNIHHDAAFTHCVDQDWEVTERNFSAELDSKHPRVSVTHNNQEYHNHPAGLIGGDDRYSDGYMTTCRFY